MVFQLLSRSATVLSVCQFGWLALASATATDCGLGLWLWLRLYLWLWLWLQLWPCLVNVLWFGGPCMRIARTTRQQMLSPLGSDPGRAINSHSVAPAHSFYKMFQFVFLQQIVVAATATAAAAAVASCRCTLHVAAWLQLCPPFRQLAGFELHLI